MTSSKFFVINKELVKEIGLEPTLLLAELALWQDSCKDWFYRTQDQIKEETGLSASVQNRAVKMLRDKGLLKTKLKGLPAKLHYFIELEILNKFLNINETSISKNEKLETKKQRINIPENEETLNKKNSNKNNKKEILLNSISSNLQKHINDYFEYRAEIKKPFKSQKSIETRIEQFIAQSKKYGELAVVESIEASISNGWQGTFIDKKYLNNTSNNKTYEPRNQQEQTFGFIQQVTNFEL
jgi:hypothetical protein